MKPKRIKPIFFMSRNQELIGEVVAAVIASIVIVVTCVSFLKVSLREATWASAIILISANVVNRVWLYSWFKSIQSSRKAKLPVDHDHCSSCHQCMKDGQPLNPHKFDRCEECRHLILRLVGPGGSHIEVPKMTFCRTCGTPEEMRLTELQTCEECGQTHAYPEKDPEDSPHAH